MMRCRAAVTVAAVHVVASLAFDLIARACGRRGRGRGRDGLDEATTKTPALFEPSL